MGIYPSGHHPMLSSNCFVSMYLWLWWINSLSLCLLVTYQSLLRHTSRLSPHPMILGLLSTGPTVSYIPGSKLISSPGQRNIPTTDEVLPPDQWFAGHLIHTVRHWRTFSKLLIIQNVHLINRMPWNWERKLALVICGNWKNLSWKNVDLRYLRYYSTISFTVVVLQVCSSHTCGNYRSRWWPLNSTTNGCDWSTCELH